MGTMLEFKEYITEELSTGSLEKSSFIILKYLRKATGISKMFVNQGLEKFKNSNGAGYGVRFYAPGKKIESWRFNWKAVGSANTNNLSSIDLWNGTTQGPNYHISFDTDVSLVQILPQLADMIKAGKVKTGSFVTYPNDVPLNESLEDGDEVEELNEAVNPEDAFDSVVSLISSPGFTKHKVYKVWKYLGTKIFNEIEARNPMLIVKDGRQYNWTGSDKDVTKLLSQRADILSAIGTTRGTVRAGSSKETYSHNAQLDELEASRDRLAYDKQLADLENLIKMTVSGASNALFIAGRGGIGKTFTVEKVLKELGLSDGNGYFKNTGTASAAGIYSLLFKNQNGVILFDDSDDALKDQEARNIFKAATDTKKIRKLVWNKMGKNIVEPDEYEDPQELIDANLLPRYFNFTGKIIFISNLKMDKLDPDGAIRTRAFMIEIDPTETEIYDFMETIVDKVKLDGDLDLDSSTRKKVVDMLRKGKSKQSANLRKLSRALNMMAGTLKSGVSVSEGELTRMIETYATWAITGGIAAFVYKALALASVLPVS
jgi:hypothetical protein